MWKRGALSFPPQDPRETSLTAFSQFTAFNRCCILNQKVNVRPFEKPELADKREKGKLLCFVLFCFLTKRCLKWQLGSLTVGHYLSLAPYQARGVSTLLRRHRPPFEPPHQKSLTTLWKPQSQRAFGPKPETALNWPKGYLQGPSSCFYSSRQ